LFLISGDIKIIEDIIKRVDMVVCPLGKPKSVSKSKLLMGRAFCIKFFIKKGNIVAMAVDIVKL
jgi:hypothetical protein